LGEVQPFAHWKWIDTRFRLSVLSKPMFWCYR
jgi:hypothetical protein